MIFPILFNLTLTTIVEYCKLTNGKLEPVSLLNQNINVTNIFLFPFVSVLKVFN
jgi:hypothetical protein